ncbi:MAG: macro domain-containing protein [Elusimicrobia bacterium]|nr:macro domain-containing protein [Elusimicrobiota bacterium]
MTEKKIKDTTLRLVRGDIAAMEVDAFVFYARPDLQLGSGFGTAITQRGGPAVKKELEKLGPVATGSAVVTAAGEMKCKRIIHAVGPRFQEEDEERKLREVMRASLKKAEEGGVKTLAFPPMGTGFYGITLDLCRKVMLDELRRHLEGPTALREVSIVVKDSREQTPFEEAFKSL